MIFTPFHWLLVVFAGGFSTIVAAYVKYYHRPIQDEAITPEPLPPAPPVVPEVPPTPAVDKIKLFCLAHEKFEGYAPGTTAYKHCNPGNLKNTDGTWQTFSSYEIGFTALENYVRRVIAGRHPAYPKGGDTSIKEYVSIYAPDGPTIIANYSRALATAVGTTPDQKMSWLLT